MTLLTSTSAITSSDAADASGDALLRVDDVRIEYRTKRGIFPAVRGVSLELRRGETVALVGESGSGKTTLAHSLIGLLPRGGHIAGGSVTFQGVDLAAASENRLRHIRGSKIGLVPQDPSVSLNPVKKVGEQIAEALRIHRLANRREAAARAVEILGSVGIDDPETRAGQYPHELSGGMRQRVLIGIALACEPQLIIADEPTSALDVTVQRTVLDTLEARAKAAGTAVLLITHDLGVAADRADRIVVLNQGRVEEDAPSHEILTNPRAAYTKRLLAAAPSLASARLRARSGASTATPGNAIEFRGVSKDFTVRRADGSKRVLHAVKDVTFAVERGSTLAIVGESGSGKSTTARLATRLEDASAGEILLDGADISQVAGRELQRLRARVQLVFQNPYASLDPKFSIGQIIEEPLRAFRRGTPAERSSRVAELLDQVALPASSAAKLPGELSGGQRQRVAIARALALHPELLVLDEPVSALDVSVQSQVLELLAETQERLGLTFLFITHDLAVVRQIADDVVVMRRGSIVESGAVRDVFDAPRHEYTRELLAAIPGQRVRDEPRASTQAATNADEPGDRND